MDFSVHEQRRLAAIEQDLATDRRLTALMGVLSTKRGRGARCLAVRLRHPWHGPVGARSQTVSRVSLALAIAVTLMAPPVLIAAVVAGIEALAIAATAAIPVAIVLLIISYRRAKYTL